MQHTENLEWYWNTIPIGKENAIAYSQLCELWEVKERRARFILHDLSAYDSGDNYVLVRSSRCRGFYRTDDVEEMKAFKAECLNRGRNCFAPIKKINRVLSDENDAQLSVFNNLKAIRIERNIKQKDVVRYMRKFDRSFDCSMLSRFENGVCLPTPYQLRRLADFYACEPFRLVALDLDAADLYSAI